MFKLPDGKEVVVSSCDGLAVLLTSGEDGSRFKLQGFIELFTRTESKAVKELIRGKDKAEGEEVAPLVKSLMAHGMSLATARNRHSDVKALWYGWNHGVSGELSNGNGWQSAVDIARNKKAADDKAAQIIADRQAVIALRDSMEQEAEAAGIEPDLVLIKETAVAEYEEVKAAETAEKKLAGLEKAANKVGKRLFSLYPTLADVMLVVTAFGLYEIQSEIQHCIDAEDVARKENERVTAAMKESERMHVVHEIAAHKQEKPTLEDAVKGMGEALKAMGAEIEKQQKPVTA